MLRSGRVNKRVLFKYETFDGSAKRGKDYVSRTETLVFNPGETEKFITVEVLPDHEKEADDIFFVKLGLEDFADGRTAIGPNNVAQVSRELFSCIFAATLYCSGRHFLPFFTKVDCL